MNRRCDGMLEPTLVTVMAKEDRRCTRPTWRFRTVKNPKTSGNMRVWLCIECDHCLSKYEWFRTRYDAPIRLPSQLA